MRKGWSTKSVTWRMRKGWSTKSVTWRMRKGWSTKSVTLRMRRWMTAGASHIDVKWGVGGAFQPRIQPQTKISWILTWPLPPFLDQFWVWSDQFLIEWHQKWHMPAQLHLVKQRIKNVQARNGSFNHTHSPCMWLFNVRKEPPRPSYKWIRIWMFWGAFFPPFFFPLDF